METFKQKQILEQMRIIIKKEKKEIRNKEIAA